MGVRVKGSAFVSRLLWVRLRHGEDGLQTLRPRLSPEARDLVESGAVMAKWYPFAWFLDLSLGIDSLFGQGDLALVRALGRHGAEANLTTIYRLFYRVGTVKWILSRATRLWGMHYDSGRLVVEPRPGKEVEARIEDFAEPHRVHCLSVIGWTERSLELSGGKDVVLEELACRANGDDTCRMRVAWR